MDTQRCQNHGPVRLLVPLWEFNHKGTKTLTGFFATFYARATLGNSAAPEIGSCLVGQFLGLNADHILQPFLRQVVLSQNGSPHEVYRMHRSN